MLSNHSSMLHQRSHRESQEVEPDVDENLQLEKDLSEISTSADEPVVQEQPQTLQPLEQEITNEEIQALIDSEFKKDETGQYEDIEGVFGKLDELATEYNDESIRELLYFDENTGGFVWKQ